MSARSRYILVMFTLAGALVAALVITLQAIIDDASKGSVPDAATPTASMVADAATAPATEVAPHPTASAEATEAQLPTLVGDAPVPELSVGPPTLAAPINGLARVREYYSEAYTHDIFTVRWRPGAFPPERAELVAELARRALDHDNALLGTNDNEPLEIFLVDTLFNDECVGCQGFAASDLRQVFMLQDGSVAEDELPVLLAHEIGHVLAGNYIALPDDNLFFAEGWAVWVSEQFMRDAGYIDALQTAAWAKKAGVLPSLAELRDASLSGRVRARAEYDGAASFTHFVIDTYGLDVYKQLYSKQPPEDVLGKDWATLEQEWLAYLDRWADATVVGVTAEQWWDVAERVISGYVRLYQDPATVSAEQYAELASARLALNRGDLPRALALANASGLTVGAAN